MSCENQDPRQQIRTFVDTTPKPLRGKLLQDRGIAMEYLYDSGKKYEGWADKKTLLAEPIPDEQLTTPACGDVVKAVVHNTDLLIGLDIDPGIHSALRNDVGNAVAANQERFEVLAAFVNHVDLDNPPATAESLKREFDDGTIDQQLALTQDVHDTVILQQDLQLELLKRNSV